MKKADPVVFAMQHDRSFVVRRFGLLTCERSVYTLQSGQPALVLR